MNRKELLDAIETNAGQMTDKVLLASIDRSLNADARVIYRIEAVRRGLIQPNSAAEYAAGRLSQDVPEGEARALDGNR